MYKHNFYRPTAFVVQLVFVFAMYFHGTPGLAADNSDSLWINMEEGNGDSKASSWPRLTPCRIVTALAFGLLAVGGIANSDILPNYPSCAPPSELSDFGLGLSTSVEKIAFHNVSTSAETDLDNLDWLPQALCGQGITEVYSEQPSDCSIASSPTFSSLLSDIVDGLKSQEQLLRDYPSESLWEKLAHAASTARGPALRTALGYCYLTGKGIIKDEHLAADQFQQVAIQQGFASALFRLGYCYAHGFGVVMDLHLAAELYSQAADQGLATAQYSLALLYRDGVGIAQNQRRRVELLRQAAAQGHVQAQQELAKVKYGEP